MSAPFIDETGFHALGLNAWQALIQGDFQTAYGSDIDLGADSPDGQIIGTLAGRFNDLEQQIQNVYNGRSPAGAVGAGLSRLVQLNGISRKFSTAPVTLTGTPGTVIPSGSPIASSADPNKPPFATTATLTIGGGGTVAGEVQCTSAGAVGALVGELTVVQTAVSGWSSVTNTSGAAPGEADPALRIRREAAVAMPTQSLSDRLRAVLLKVSGVTDARVYANNSGAVDAKSLPPHSINAIVAGTAADADIANAIWFNSSMGVTQVGAQSYTLTDTQGNPQTQRWDNPTDVDVYITIKLSFAPTNLLYLQDQMGKAICAFYSASGDLPIEIGDNVFWADILTPVNALGLTGRTGLPSITNVYLGSTAGPTLQQDLPISYNGLAVFDVSRIFVVGP